MPLNLTFPAIIPYSTIAEHFQDIAAADFGWDADSEDSLDQHIADYSTAFHSSPKLTEYLKLIGYECSDNCVTIRSKQALYTANTIFAQVSHEYDELDCPRVKVVRYGHPRQQTPTWAMFELGGDDDVDYCGGQPSCLTALILTAMKED